ncbi:MAG TPA: glycosyl transferase family 2 [Bdellovibrionales bacterium]|nr:glycosyl transferase family 2 [Pseudobdellovibrionaceae bacterium]HAG90408.1 glycosyl transferase family 2 [Bdellovibrionales bacterium]|tara:strand:+ start:3711 stop:4442 length:732 start_codon:yes stop_codon:yes gene_type:complete
MGDLNRNLSVVVPCYNEAENLPLIFQKFEEAVGERKDVEVVLVDNGSTDSSSEVFARELERGNRSEMFSLIRVDKNQGYGYGILQGLNAARGGVLGWTHADLQTDPLDVVKAYDLFLAANSSEVLVKGKRKKRRFFESLLTLGMQYFSGAVLGVYVEDINAQPKIFHRCFFEEHVLPSAPYDFSLDLYLLLKAKRNGISFLELPVYFGKRLHGEAKGGGSWRTRYKVILRTIRFIFALRQTGF